jgi:SAM-dependent methyltransferase
MRMRGAEEPEEMVGRDPQAFEKHGRWQLQYLQQWGLGPGDRLLDVGCGPLRLGRHAVECLEHGGYTGFDLSERCIAAAEAWLDRHGWRGASVFVSGGNRVRLGQSFDVVWAQSVVTHVPPHQLEGFGEMVAHHVAEDGVALVTFREAGGDEVEVSARGTGFSYPLNRLVEVLEGVGLVALDVDRDSGHPHGQDVLLLRGV